LYNSDVFRIMSANLTYNIRLLTQSEDDHNLLLSTLIEHQNIWNHLSKWVYQTKLVDKKRIHDDNYHQCRKLFPDAPSQVIIRAKDSVYATYKALKTSKTLSQLEEPCQQTNLSIRLDKRLYTFLDGNRIKLTTTGKRIICSYQPYDKFKKLFSKYSSCDPLVFVRDNQFWLSVSFEVPEPTFVENTCIGVDLGERRFAVTSEGLALTDKDFLQQKRRLRYRKRILHSNVDKRHSCSGRRKLRKLARKERNKNRNLSHHLANKILETSSNTIVLEDLSNLKKKNLKKTNYKKSKSSKNRLSQVPFRMLRDILTYKAPLKGKRVVTVDPYMTSQRDHRGLVKGERRGCRYYASDHKVFDADWNAAINIAHVFSDGQKKNGIEHPVSFSFPFDGGLNWIGRLLSTSQWSSSEGKPLRL
jgi:IS605 OrfB family transposase